MDEPQFHKPDVIDQTRDLAAEKRIRLARIAKNSAFMLAGNVAIKSISFLFSVYVVRRLGAEDYGIYSSIMAFAFIFAMLTDLGMGTLAIREMARNEASSRWMVPNIMALRAVFSVLVIAGNVLAAWLLGKPPEIVLGIFIASLGLLLYSFQGPLEGLLIAKEKLYVSSFLNVLIQVTFVIVGTIALLSGMGYLGLLIATLLGVLLAGIASLIFVKRALKETFLTPDVRRWWEILKGGFPFGVIGLVTEFTARFDIVFMSFILTYSAVGFYNVSLNLIQTTLLLAQSLALALFPAMVKEYDSGRGSIKDTVQRSLRYMFLVSLPLAVGGTLVADRLIYVLYGSGFEEAVPVFRIMIWALPFMFLAEILGRTSIVMHMEKKVAVYIIINAVISISLSLILIPTIGVIGAALIAVINRLNSVILSIVVIGPKIVFEGNVKPIARVALTGAFMGLGVWGLQQIPWMKTLGDLNTLLVLVGFGSVLYLSLAFLLKAVSSGEALFLVEALKRRLRHT